MMEEEIRKTKVDKQNERLKQNGNERLKQTANESLDEALRQIELDKQIERANQIEMSSPLSTAKSKRQAEWKKQKEVKRRTEWRRRTELKNQTQQGIKSFLQRPWIGKTALVAITSLIAASIFPIVGPAAALVTVAAAITSIQEDLKRLGLPLPPDTIKKFIEPLHGQNFDESQVQEVTEGLVSKDRVANEDLKRYYQALVPIIKKEVAATTHIEISGPVQGLIVNPNQSTITQTFHDFLPKE